MNNKGKTEGERFSLYFPPSQEYLLNYINNQVDENGKKINRNKFILKVIDEHFQRNQKQTTHYDEVNYENVSNQDLLNELQQLKEIIKEIKTIDSTTQKSNTFHEISLDIEEDSNSSSISLTKEELNQLNNPTF